MLTKSMTALVAMGLMASASAYAHPTSGNAFGSDHDRRIGRDDGHKHGRGREGHDRHYDGRPAFVEVRVVDVRPVVQHVVVERPRRVCRDEVVDVREGGLPYGVAGPTIAGGIVGAAIGRQFGSGGGRDAMTMLGALAGSAVAHDRALRHAAEQPEVVHERTVRRCRIVEERHLEERRTGYDVTYEYEGRRRHMHSDEAPGDRIRLQLGIVLGG
ncbi:MAG TPA: glycine zipper 2TM domain-containing protein [Gammaproteobacteria bacterium]|nr:glycine zipper 2TM domain-containing protein [Gammaproteobacteria bacterium]